MEKNNKVGAVNINRTNMKMVKNLWLFICLLLFLFTGCTVEQTKEMPKKMTREQIEAFRAVRVVRLYVEEDCEGTEGHGITAIERIVENFFNHAKVIVEGIDSVNYDATVTVLIKGKALSSTYSDLQSHYTSARIVGSISLEKAGVEVYKKSFKGENEPHPFIYGGGMKPADAPFTHAILTSNFKTKVGEMIGQIYGTEVLDLALKDKEADVREGAAEVLGKIGGPQAVDYLIESLKDKSPLVQKAAAKALGEIGDPRAIVFLEELAEKNNYLSGKEAKKALQEIEKKGRKRVSCL